MECVAGIKHTPWENFIPPSFHTIVLFTISVIVRHNLREKLSWLVDGFACILLLVGTYARLIILDGKALPHDCHDTRNSEYVFVSDYFRFSVTSWVCIIIIDAKSCYYISSQPFWKLQRPKSFTEFVKTFVVVMLSSASVISWLFFCTDVHRTFEYLTKEWLLISYYIAAACLKVASVFLQRVFFISYIMNHSPSLLHIPNISPQDRKVMCRMAIVNVVEVFHVLGLMWFSVLHSESKWTTAGFYRVALLAVEIVFKLYISCWYFRNSCLYKRCRQLSVKERLVAARTHLRQTLANSIAHLHQALVHLYQTIANSIARLNQVLILTWHRSVAFLLLVLNRFTQLLQTAWFTVIQMLLTPLWIARVLCLGRRDAQEEHAPPITPGNDELAIVNTFSQSNAWGELVTLHPRPEQGQEEVGPQLRRPQLDIMVITISPPPLVGARGALVVGVVGWHQLMVRGACLDVFMYWGLVIVGPHRVDIVLIRWSHTKRLFVPRLEDHCHLHPPLHTTATFPAPCVQETQHRVPMEILVGEQR